MVSYWFPKHQTLEHFRFGVLGFGIFILQKTLKSETMTPPALFYLQKILLDIWDFLHFHVSSSMYISPNLSQNFDRYCIIFIDHRRVRSHLSKIESSYKHEMSSLFRLPLLIIYLLVLVYNSYTSLSKYDYRYFIFSDSIVNRISIVGFFYYWYTKMAVNFVS